MFGRRHTPSAPPSLLMFRIDRPIARISPSLVFVPSPSQWFFNFGEEIVITWTLTGWERWMSQNLPFPAPEEVRDRWQQQCYSLRCHEELWVLYHQVSSISPESVPLRSLRQSERTTTRDPVHHKRWTYPCFRAVNTEHQQRWTRWCCTTPSKYLAKGDK